MKKLFFNLLKVGAIGLIVLLAYIFGFTNGTSFERSGFTQSVQAIKQINEDKLFETVNQWRKNQGKQTYKISPVLCGYATQRVKEIQVDWSHNGFKKITSQEEIYKFQNFSRTGENLLRDFSEENSGLESWLNSPEHRKNLDDDFTQSCIRCENNYCVQLFGR